MSSTASCARCWPSRVNATHAASSRRVYAHGRRARFRQLRRRVEGRRGRGASRRMTYGRGAARARQRWPRGSRRRARSSDRPAAAWPAPDGRRASPDKRDQRVERENRDRLPRRAGRGRAGFRRSCRHLSARVCVSPLSRDQGEPIGSAEPQAGLGDLEWADGIAVGTPVGDGAPTPVLMWFIADTEPLWRSGGLYEKAVTYSPTSPSTSRPTRSCIRRTTRCSTGGGDRRPRAFELDLDSQPDRTGAGRLSPLPGPRLKTARYWTARLARLPGVLADDRARRARLQM